MCNFNPNRDLEMKVMEKGLNLISKAMEASLRVNNPIQSTDILQIATVAYQQGKITKSQFIGVINALDEQTYQTNAYAVPQSNLTRYWR